MTDMTGEQILRENLLFLAKTFAKKRGWSLSTLSKQIHGNQSFLKEFSRGEASTSIKTYFLMVNRLRTLWPPELEWPDTTPLPKLGRNVDKGFKTEK